MKLQNTKGQGGTATILQGTPELRIQRDSLQKGEIIITKRLMLTTAVSRKQPDMG